jgi:hypothetical protein
MRGHQRSEMTTKKGRNKQIKVGERYRANREREREREKNNIYQQGILDKESRTETEASKRK